MLTRLLAAIVALGIVLPGLIWGGPIVVEGILVPLVLLVCMTEYVAMAFPDDRTVASVWLTAAVGAIYATVLYGPATWVAPVGGLLVMVTMIVVVLRPPEPLTRAPDVVGRYLLGMGYLSLPIFFVLLWRLEHGLAWIFTMMAIAFLGDTGGYFAGKHLGSHKLYPLISPKKTWEGVVGGVTLAIIGLFVVRAVGFPQLLPVECVALGLLALMGVIGDLCESMLKRAFEVKDSGWIMPGHGGLLDRIDGLMFVGACLYAYTVLVKGGV